MNETIQGLFTELDVDMSHHSDGLEKLASTESRYLKDIKLNIGAVLKSGHITRKEAFLLALAVAVNERCSVLTKAFERQAEKEGASAQEITEIHACTSLMNANNVFYRFRHYLSGNPYYNNTPAGLRMSIMMNPVMGKEFFELVSLAVSALNGCERCVTSHEASVKQHGASEARIYDAIRLTAVIKSLVVLV